MEKESYTFLIDSKTRDISQFPNSNSYTIDFNSPFHDVISLELLNCHVPRSEYNIDVDNNTFRYILDDDEQFVYDIDIPPGDYTLLQLIEYMNNTLQGGVEITVVSSPYSLTNTVRFDRPTGTFAIVKSSLCKTLGLEYATTHAHIRDNVEEASWSLPPIDQTATTTTITFTSDVDAAFLHSVTYTIRDMTVPNGTKARDIKVTINVRDTGEIIGSSTWYPALSSTVTFPSKSIELHKDKLYTIEFDSPINFIDLASNPEDQTTPAASIMILSGIHSIEPKNVVNLTGENNTIFIRCPEIESLIYRERFNEHKLHTGMGYMKMSIIGQNEAAQSNYFIGYPARILSNPLSRFKRMSIRIETTQGTLYNTRGLDHQLLFRITYYKPSVPISIDLGRN